MSIPPEISSHAQTEADINKRSAHQRFNWIDTEHPLAEFFSHAYDMLCGIALTLEIIQAADLKRVEMREGDNTVQPDLNLHDSDQLFRFALAAARCLRNEAEGRIEEMNSFGFTEAARAYINEQHGE